MPAAAHTYYDFNNIYIYIYISIIIYIYQKYISKYNTIPIMIAPSHVLDCLLTTVIIVIIAVPLLMVCFIGSVVRLYNS
jgi:hypothetical protein